MNAVIAVRSAPAAPRCAPQTPSASRTSRRSRRADSHAVWIAENCVVSTDGVHCNNCSRHCPAGAIKMVPATRRSAVAAHSGRARRALHRLWSLREPLPGASVQRNLCRRPPTSANHLKSEEMEKKKIDRREFLKLFGAGGRRDRGGFTAAESGAGGCRRCR